MNAGANSRHSPLDGYKYLMNSALFQGTDGVLKLSQTFNSLKLRFEMDALLKIPEAQDAWKTFNQLGLNHRPGQGVWSKFRDGCGSLYDKDRGEVLAETGHYTERSTDLPYINEVMTAMEQMVTSYGRRVGRVRFMKQEVKTCLSLHVDLDEFRFHVPIITSSKAFFVVNNVVVRMPQPGGVYLLNTSVPHTAVNADGAKDRIHLLFDTW